MSYAESSLRPFLSRQEIQSCVERLAGEIQRDYVGKSPLVVGVLKGSFVFLSDLVRHLDLPLEVDFIRLSSYGAGTKSSGRVKVVQGLRSSLRGRDVLVVEDIVDSGLSLSFLLGYLRKKKPASLKLCVLLDKAECRVEPVSIDYLGFTVPAEFLVGYGLDCNEQFRHLPEICVLEQGCSV